MCEIVDRTYLTVAEFARRCGVYHRTVRRWIVNGVIPSVQPSGPRSRILIPVAAIHQLGMSDRPATEDPSTSSTGSNEANAPKRRRGRRPGWQCR
jgi:excisionase family DNA binding protein